MRGVRGVVDVSPLDPKIWFDGLYHLTIEVKVHSTDRPPDIELRRVCERDRRYEGEHDVYWPFVTCLECVALELQRLQRAMDFVEFRAWIDEAIDLEVT